MKIRAFTLVLLLSASCWAAESPDLQTLARSRNYWPTRKWDKKPSGKSDPKFAEQMMKSAECQDFTQFLIKSKDQSDGLQTDALLIIKGGVIQYEYYDGIYGPQTPHCLWSASK